MSAKLKKNIKNKKKIDMVKQKHIKGYTSRKIIKNHSESDISNGDEHNTDTVDSNDGNNSNTSNDGDDNSSNRSDMIAENYSIYNFDWKPNPKDDKWIETNAKTNDYIYYSYVDVPHVELTITKEIIEELRRGFIMKEKNDIMNEIKVYKLIKMYDVNTIVYAYTSTSISDYLISTIRTYLKNTAGKLSNFTSLDGVKCQLIACYKGDITVQELNFIRNSYENTEKYNDDVINVHIKIFNKLIKDTKSELVNISEKKYYIYKFCIDNDPKYIYGSYNLLSKKIFDEIIDKFMITTNDIMTYDLLSTLQCKLECEGLLKVDSYIRKFNTIDKGLNKCYNVILDIADNRSIKTKLFLQIQKNIMCDLLRDNIDYTKTNGYIASIENNVGDKYIFSGIMPLKNMLEYFYELGIESPFNYQKICNLLSRTNYKDLKITILEKFAKDIDKINIKLQTYINQLNYGKNNYDVDTLRRIVNKTVYGGKRKHT